MVCEHCGWSLHYCHCEPGTKLAKGEVMIVRSEMEDSTEWGVSTGGPNPDEDKYFAVKDYDTALRLNNLIVNHAV